MDTIKVSLQSLVRALSEHMEEAKIHLLAFPPQAVSLQRGQRIGQVLQVSWIQILALILASYLTLDK